MQLLKSIFYDVSTGNTCRINGKKERFSRFLSRTQRNIHGFRFDALDFLKIYSSMSVTFHRASAVFSARVSTALLTEPLDFLNFGRYVNTPVKP